MNDFYMFRIGSGLYDVPLDGPKQRFGQPDNVLKKMDLAQAFDKFRDRPTPSLSDDIYV